MSQSDYSDHYDPTRNPNSAMSRVLHNADYDETEITPSITSGEGEEDRWVQVILHEVTGKLIREADRAGFRFIVTESMDDGTVRALFRVMN